jgi:hypothetical protein
MNIYITILLLLLLFLILYRICKPLLNKETFIDTGPRHVKLNDFGGVDYVDRMPPVWRGEGPCSVVTCPAVFADDTVCWKCQWRIAEPQNE